MTASLRSRPRVLIDCDPGHDDLFAIGVAAAHCDVVGITAVAGNSPIENTVRNAIIAADLFGLDHVPVHAGARGPLAGGHAVFAFDAHGRTGLDGPPPRVPSRPPAGDDAIGFLIDTIRAEEGLWLVAVGPLTNVALALRAAPDLARRVAGISVMGGSLSHGNVTSAAEFNVHFDPEAAAEVFESGAPLKMCGLDLTHQVTADADFADALAAQRTQTAFFCAQLLGYYQAFAARIRGRAGAEGRKVGAPLHDPCAVLAITHPELFETRRLHVVVETAGTHTRGMTLADVRPWADAARANVEAAVRVDGGAAARIVFAAIAEKGTEVPRDMA